MEIDITTLAITAGTIGFFHTLFGPDHYLPFIAMAKARDWSMLKTSVITFLCGLGHVGGSVILGSIGIISGLAISSIEYFEGFRGNIAAWLLTIFGLIYFIWGMKNAYQNKKHSHIHFHNDGVTHLHTHSHKSNHKHAHPNGESNITPWVLFTIFVLGPCEPLIPILMYPAANHNIFGLIIVTAIFCIVTITTMMSIVLLSTFGLRFVSMEKINKYNHALAGAALSLCGFSILFLGL